MVITDINVFSPIWWINYFNPRFHSGSIYLRYILTMEFLVELLNFIKERKKYWLVPIILLLLMLGGLIVVTQGSAIAPFIYTIF